jgi:hypothetical protein
MESLPHLLTVDKGGQAEAQTEVQPEPMAADLHAEAVVFIAVGWNGGVHVTIMAHRAGAV